MSGRPHTTTPAPATSHRAHARRLLKALRKAVPRFLDPVKYVNERGVAISRLTTALAGGRQGLAAPSVRHRRRRANAHRSYAVPVDVKLKHQRRRALRAAAAGVDAEGDAVMVATAVGMEGQRPPRPVRRRPSRLHATWQRDTVAALTRLACGGEEVADNDGGPPHRRLATHLWHAKRFTMASRWGVLLPHTRHDARTQGLALRAATTAACAVDISWLIPCQVSMPAGGAAPTPLLTALGRVLDPGAWQAIAHVWGVPLPPRHTPAAGGEDEDMGAWTQTRAARARARRRAARDRWLMAGAPPAADNVAAVGEGEDEAEGVSRGGPPLQHEGVELDGFLHECDAFPAGALAPVYITLAPHPSPSHSDSPGLPSFNVLLWLHPTAATSCLRALRAALGMPPPPLASSAGVSPTAPIPAGVAGASGVEMALVLSLSRFVVVGPLAAALVPSATPPTPTPTTTTARTHAAWQGMTLPDLRVRRRVSGPGCHPLTPALAPGCSWLWDGPSRGDVNAAMPTNAACTLHNSHVAAARLKSGFNAPMSAPELAAWLAVGGTPPHQPSTTTRASDGAGAPPVQGGDGTVDGDGDDGGFMTLKVDKPAKRLKLAVVEAGDDLAEYDVGSSDDDGSDDEDDEGEDEDGDGTMGHGVGGAAVERVPPASSVVTFAACQVQRRPGGALLPVPVVHVVVPGCVAAQVVWRWLVVTKHAVPPPPSTSVVPSPSPLSFVVTHGGWCDMEAVWHGVLGSPVFPRDYPDTHAHARYHAEAEWGGMMTTCWLRDVLGGRWSGDEGGGAGGRDMAASMWSALFPPLSSTPVVIRGGGFIKQAITVCAAKTGLKAAGDDSAHHDTRHSACTPDPPTHARWSWAPDPLPRALALSRPSLVLVSLHTVTGGRLRFPAAIYLLPKSGCAPWAGGGVAGSDAAPHLVTPVRPALGDVMHGLLVRSHGSRQGVHPNPAAMVGDAPVGFVTSPDVAFSLRGCSAGLGYVRVEAMAAVACDIGRLAVVTPSSSALRPIIAAVAPDW